jgi:hypothetical protein
MKYGCKGGHQSSSLVMVLNKLTEYWTQIRLTGAPSSSFKSYKLNAAVATATPHNVIPRFDSEMSHHPERNRRPLLSIPTHLNFMMTVTLQTHSLKPSLLEVDSRLTEHRTTITFYGLQGFRSVQNSLALANIHFPILLLYGRRVLMCVGFVTCKPVSRQR